MNYQIRPDGPVSEVLQAPRRCLAVRRAALPIRSLAPGVISTIEIPAGSHTNTAADPLSDDLRQALEAINGTAGLRIAWPKPGLTFD